MKATILILLTSIFIHSNITQASSDAVTLGIGAGIGSPSVNGTSYLSDRALWELNGSYGIKDDLSVGAYINYSGQTQETTGRHNFWMSGIEATFSTASLHGLFGGMRAGITNGRITVPSGTFGDPTILTKTGTEFSFGPKIGYALNITGPLSAEMALGSMFQTVNKYTVTQYLLSLKYALGSL